jgi:hypothetical protein
VVLPIAQKIVRFWAVVLTSILFFVHQQLVFILATEAGTQVILYTYT